MVYYMNGAAINKYAITAPVSDIFSSADFVKTLMNMGICCLEDMIRMGPDVICPICQLWGVKDEDCDDLKDFLNHLWSAPGGFLLNPTNQATTDFLDAEKNRGASELSIETLDLPTKVKHALIRGGILTVEDLEEVDRKQLENMPGVGSISVDQIEQVLRAFVQKKLGSQKIDDQTHLAEVRCLNFMHSLSQYCPALSLRIHREILPFFFDACEEGREVDFTQVYGTAALRTVVREKLFQTISKKHFDGVSHQTLRDLFPEELLPVEVMQNLLLELEQTGQIEIEETVRQKFMTALQYIEENVTEPRLKDCLIQRIHGVHKEGIAKIYGVSRERVRQMIAKWYQSKDVLLHEDRYIPIFQKYMFRKDVFVRIFNEPIETYHYLMMVLGRKGSLPLSALSKDPEISTDLRCIVMNNISKKRTIVLDGEERLLQKRTMVEYLVFSHFRDEGTVDQLVQLYQRMLREYGLEDDPAFVMDRKGCYEYELSHSDLVLFQKGPRFRYYNIWSRNYKRLLEGLALDQFHDVEYSARKLYADNLSLMREYDLRDEYELYKLLQKIRTRYQISNIRFKSMPTLAFGDADQSRQMFQIIQQNAPISKSDAIALYKELYGIRLNRDSASLEPLNNYYDGHVYRLDALEVDV